MSVNMDDSFQMFTELLHKRFDEHVFTTEDSVRYALFHSLINTLQIDPMDVILEFPHPQIPRAEIDTYIQAKNGNPPIVFEFKFDREIPSGKNSPRPMKAGKLFADLFRLAKYKIMDSSAKCFFVYVTDSEMAYYMRNKSNNLDKFFDMSVGSFLQIDEKYVKDHSDTFVTAANSITPCHVKSHLKSDFNNGYHVRIYEVVME